MPTSTEIIHAGRLLIGTPWHHQARCPGVGIDCIGLLVCVARALSVPHQDCVTYTRDPNPEQFLRELSRSLVRLPIDSAVAQGLVGVFWIRHANEPKHAAIFTDRGMIHTHQSVGKVVEHSIGELWQKRLHSIWSFPEWQL